MADNIDKEFYLTRGEYAKKIGKSKGSVIQSMRRGGLTNEYIIRIPNIILGTLKDPVHLRKCTWSVVHTKEKLIVVTTTKPTIQTTRLDNTMRLNVCPRFSTKYLKEFKIRFQKLLRGLRKRNERQCKRSFVSTQNYDSGPVKNPFDRRYGGMLTQREMRKRILNQRTMETKSKKEYY